MGITCLISSFRLVFMLKIRWRKQDSVQNGQQSLAYSRLVFLFSGALP